MKMPFLYFLMFTTIYTPIYTMELRVQSSIDQKRLAESFTHIAPSTISASLEQLMHICINQKNIAPSLIPKTVLVFGKQGTGKTSIIKGLAQYFNATINDLFIPELIMSINHKPQHIKNIHDVIHNCYNETITQAISSKKSMAIIHLDKCHYLKNATALAHGIILEDLITIIKKQEPSIPTLLMVEYENTCPPAYIPKFDYTIHVEEPDFKHIQPIMQFHATIARTPLSATIDWQKIGINARGLTGNILQKIIHHAAGITSKKDALYIQESDLIDAITLFKKLLTLCEVAEKKIDEPDDNNAHHLSMYS